VVRSSGSLPCKPAQCRRLARGRDRAMRGGVGYGRKDEALAGNLERQLRWRVVRDGEKKDGARVRARARKGACERACARVRKHVPHGVVARLCTCTPRPARAAKSFHQARILSARLQPTLSRGACCASCPARSVVTRSLVGSCVLSVWPYELVVARAMSRRLGVHISAVELAVETTRVV